MPCTQLKVLSGGRVLLLGILNGKAVLQELYAYHRGLHEGYIVYCKVREEYLN